MIGLSTNTGRRIAGIDHLRQSIRDILQTPIGSRVMRRDYGSRLFELVDSPLTEAGQLDIIAATAEALIRWEPRIEVEVISIPEIAPGKVTIDLVGEYLPDGQRVAIQGIEVS